MKMKLRFPGSKILKIFAVAFLYAFTCNGLHAQKDSIFETDPAILQRIDEWKDLKFGFMMHWGPYSQWGVVESWSICPEDEDWCSRNGADYNDYVQRYHQLQETFNPLKFNPQKWAQAAQNAGMRYLVFTTKHHDGFCMYDSKQTNYKITDLLCPYSAQIDSDVSKRIFNEFRQKGFWIGAYFSKPDWNSPYYWSPQWGVCDRNINYDPKKHPELWNSFCDFTYKQIEEVMSNYGQMDILWLDGGWVRPEWSLNEETRPWVGCRGFIQDVNIPKIAKMARQKHPKLLVVDRSVHGKYENYRTPEQQIPEKEILDYPWETCMSMGGSWSYNKNDKYKSTNQLIHTLVDIVSKGGNLLLNVGPSPEGELHPDAYNRMEEISAWMKMNNACIYSSRPVAPYRNGKVRFTQLKDGTVYAIYLADKDEKKVPATIELGAIESLKTGSVLVLGSKHKAKLEKEKSGNYKIQIPSDLQNQPPCKDAWVFNLGKLAVKK